MELLTKIAKRTFDNQPFLREWDFFIAITLIAKVLTMLFSIFAGYFYFIDLFSAALNNVALAKTFAILCLVIIELSTAIAITKFFKFAIKKNVSLAVFSFLIMLTTFSISFISSTNGLALRQSEKVDNTLQIDKSYIQIVKDTKQDYTVKISDLNKLIETERQNPQGWKGKERSTLVTSQLERIESYRKEINNLNGELSAQLGKLENAKAQEIKNNKDLTNAESDKYYNLVAGIMILVFSVNGLLVYFYSKIAKGNPLTELETEAKERADKIIRKAFQDQFRNYSENKVTDVLLGSSNPDGRGSSNPDGRNTEVRNCKRCNAEFTPKHWNQRYCNDECKNLYNEKRNT